MHIAEERQELYGPRVIPIPEINVTIIEDEDIIDIQRISFYNPVVWQTDGDPSVSSCGPNVTNQIAVSQDLFFDDNGVKHLCGKTVTIVTHDGMVFDDYVIWDTMNPRFTNTVDIMLPHTDYMVAMELGITAGILYIHD